VQQFGENNFADQYQYNGANNSASAYQWGNLNNSRQYQDGNSNVADVYQEGSGNNAEQLQGGISRQPVEGGGWSYDFSEGASDANDAEIDQVGADNEALQGQYGTGSHLANAIQNGTLNQSSQVQRGNDHESTVTQSGSSNVANIIQNN
jgi:hypothetical protein